LDNILENCHDKDEDLRTIFAIPVINDSYKKHMKQKVNLKHYYSIYYKFLKEKMV